MYPLLPLSRVRVRVSNGVLVSRIVRVLEEARGGGWGSKAFGLGPYGLVRGSLLALHRAQKGSGLSPPTGTGRGHPCVRRGRLGDSKSTLER
eukprot:scaffold3181_cov389-Prasinococcus_capsulatus_cf.AAC.16